MSRLRRNPYVWLQTEAPHRKVITFVEPAAALAESSTGDLWLALDGTGLGRFRHGKVELITHAPGLLSNYVRDVKEDRDGVLWIATAGGLNRYHAGKMTSFKKEHGLPDA